MIKLLTREGWQFVGAVGSHHQFRHPTRPGKVTVVHPLRDIHPKTLASIFRQAGLAKPTR